MAWETPEGKGEFPPLLYQEMFKDSSRFDFVELY